MFGQDDNQANQIPEGSIDGALAAEDNGGQDWQHPGTPLDAGQTASAPVVQPVDAPSDATDPVVDTGAVDNLVAIKQQALSQLSPLVGHLDQSPEDKFRTTMMMIQASDDHSLVQAAYDAASQITDEKSRAQALLDIVNEINYFTRTQEG